MAASFTILTGIWSGPVALFGFKYLIISLIFTTVAGSVVKSLSSERTLSLINLMLVWCSCFTNFFQN